MNRLPNFLIIGAARSGTTALNRYLSQHPDIFMSPRKELSYFALEGQTPRFSGPGDQPRFNQKVATSVEQYCSYFRGADQHQCVGEASVLYLYHPATAGNIRRQIPRCKIVAILREPVSRAFSNYQFFRYHGLETLTSFEEALEAEEERIALGWRHMWHYTRLGFYSAQLERYYSQFAPEQILVLSYEQFREAPLAVCQSVFRFLAVDPDFKPNLGDMPNRSGMPTESMLGRMLSSRSRSRAILGRIIPPSVKRTTLARLRTAALRRSGPEPATVERLTSLYASDQAELMRLLGSTIRDPLRHQEHQ